MVEVLIVSFECLRNHERMQALIDQLQGKIKSYKKQIEEAEEIAALNLAKYAVTKPELEPFFNLSSSTSCRYRQTQNNVSAASERADSNEQNLAKMRTRARSASIGPVS